MIEFIAALFAKIGVTIGKLVEAYAARAPAEWVDPPIALAICVVLGVASWFTLKYRKHPGNDDYVIPGIVLGFCSVMALMVGLIEISDAVKATVAPHAYAVDQILDKLGDLK